MRPIPPQKCAERQHRTMEPKHCGAPAAAAAVDRPGCTTRTLLYVCLCGGYVRASYELSGGRMHEIGSVVFQTMPQSPPNVSSLRPPTGLMKSRVCRARRV